MYRLCLILILSTLGLESQAFFKLKQPTRDQLLHEYEELIVDYEQVYRQDEKLEMDYALRLYTLSVELDIDSATFVHAYELSNLYYDLDSISKSFEYAYIAESYIDSLTDPPESVGFLLNNMGTLYNYIGDYQTGLQYFYRSLDFYQKHLPAYQSYPLGNIAEYHAYFEDYETAIEYIDRTRVYTEQLQEQEDAYEYYYNHIYDEGKTAEWLIAQNQSEKAEKHYEVLLSIEDSLYDEEPYDRSYLLDAYYQGMLDLAISLERYEDARRFLDLAHEHVFEVSRHRINYLEMKYLFEVGRFEEFYQSIEDLSVKEEDFLLQSHVLDLKVRAYERLSDKTRLIESLEAKNELQKKRLKFYQNNQQDFLDIRLALSQKEQELAQLQQENEISDLRIRNQGYQLLLVLSLLSLAISSVAYLYINRRKRLQYATSLEKEVELKTRSLNKLNQDLSQKNEELRQFNYMVAHDLKEPIRSIVGFTKLLRLKTQDQKELQTYTGIIEKSGMQLSNLVADIQMYQSSESDEETAVSTPLKDVVEEVKSTLSTFISERNAAVSYHNLPTVTLQRSMMFIVFQNLIENGIKYNESNTPAISIWSEKVGAEYHIYVKDNGIGIDDDYHDMVFQMFQRLHTRSEYAGSGIGLSTTKKILRKMGAQIRILDSVVGQGTTFEIVLPVGE